MFFLCFSSHCVSQWGLDFRPAFRRLNVIRDILPDTPILALTATATAKMVYDIRSTLGLRDPYTIRTSFDRPNLEFIIHKKTGVWSDLRQWVNILFSLDFPLHRHVVYTVLLVNFLSGDQHWRWSCYCICSQTKGS